jgi:hypothetical protein
MFGRLLRVLLGFILACLVAGVAMVLFVDTPSEIAGLSPEAASTRLGKVFELASYVGVQAALFSAPFALVVAAIGEWQRNRNWSFYALAGLAIAVLGFLAQHSTEQAGQPTIVNNYAVVAFMTSGFIGGLVYWLFSGRLAGGARSEVQQDAAGPAGDALKPAIAKAMPITTAKPAAPVAAKPATAAASASGGAAANADAKKA